MGRSYQEWENEVRARLGDLGELQHVPATQLPAAIGAAIAVYSRDVPRTAFEDFAGDGTTMSWTIAGWEDGFSRLIEVEWPVGERPRSIVDPAWVEEVGGTVSLLDDAGTPQTGAQVRIWYTATYPLPNDSPDSDLIPEVAFPAVAALAAGRVLRAIAASQARHQTVSVAGATFQLEPNTTLDLAAALEAEYAEAVLGIRRAGTDETAAAVRPAYAVIDIDSDEFRLWHSGRR